MAWLTAKIAAGPIQDPVPPSDLPPAVARVTFAALEDGHCRYPVGDPRHAGFGFCGEPRVAGQSYCPTCCQRVYAPPKVRSISPAVGFKGQARVDVERISAVAQFLAT